VTLAAAVAALGVPLALGATTWEQRAALAVLVFAGSEAARRRGRTPAARMKVETPRSARSDVGGSGQSTVLAAAVALVLLTLPVASGSERAAHADGERRAGERLLALNQPERALPHLEAAGAHAQAAAVHLELAERAVATGFSGYPTAGAHLDEALRLAPGSEAQRLAAAVAAARQADVIWNQYDWPRTIGELRKAYDLRPDLPGLKEKLDAAEASYALARRAP
jgi:tetratricopeptide (TPR) repeat protein